MRKEQHYEQDFIDDDEIDLRDYWIIINRYKWGILGLAFVASLLTALVAYSLPAVYQATSTLLIEAQESKIASIEELYGFERANSEFFYTQVEILKSREIAEKVIGKLDLAAHADFDPTVRRGIQFDLKTLLFLDSSEQAQKSPVQKQALVDVFLSRLVVTPLKNTHLVSIQFEAYDPELAARVANAIAETYINNNFEVRLSATKDSAAWLTEKMGPLKTSLLDSERRLQEFRDQEHLADVEGVRTLIARELNEITTDLVEARRRRSEAENILAQTRVNREWANIPSILNHPIVQEAINEKVKAEKRIAELSKRYGPDHPKMHAAQSEYAATQANLKNQIDNVVASIEQDYEVAFKNEKALIESMKKAKQEVMDINRKEYELRELQREVETNQKLYDTFFTRFQETTATQDFEPINARLTDQAVAPRSASKPRKKLMVVLAFMCAIMLGIFIAFFLEFLKNSIRNLDDVIRILNVPALGVLPRADISKDELLKPSDIFSQTENSLAEFIRTIRTSLLLSCVDTPNRVTLVTSTVPQEGKSTISSSLAIAVGQLEKVLLIDADMRRPNICSEFSLDSKKPGLSNLVAGTNSLEECVQRIGDGNIDILTAGAIPTNPLELLSSNQFRATLEKLKERYTHIIIDSPPVQAVSDALVLAKLSTNVVFVVKADSTPQQAAQQAINRLREIGANITGAVLNQVDTSKAGDYYNYGYQYTYSYVR